MTKLLGARTGAVGMVAAVVVSGGITASAAVSAASSVRERSAAEAADASVATQQVRPRPKDVPALVITGSSTITPAGDARAGVADRLGWDLAALPRVDGTWTSSRGTRPGDLPLLVGSRPDLDRYQHIVLQGGELEYGADDASLRQAVTGTVQQLREQVRPDASITIVGPIPARLPADARTSHVNEVLRSAARDNDVLYVDAVDAGWRAGSPTLSASLADALSDVLALEP